MYFTFSYVRIFIGVFSHAGDVDAVVLDARAGEVDPAGPNVFWRWRRVVYLLDAGDLEGERLGLLRGGPGRESSHKNNERAGIPHKVSIIAAALVPAWY